MDGATFWAAAPQSATATVLRLPAGAVAQDDSVGVAAISDRYAQSIYGCVVKLGYKTLAAVIDVSVLLAMCIVMVHA